MKIVVIVWMLVVTAVLIELLPVIVPVMFILAGVAGLQRLVR